MRKALQLAAIIIILLAGFFVYQFLVPQLRPPKAFLKVESHPAAEVFLDGEQIGKTPLNQKNLRVGSHNIVLKADVLTLAAMGEASPSSKTAEFKQKIDLQTSAVTFVNYEFAGDEKFSSGEILGLRKGAGVSIVTQPDNAEVFLDDDSLGGSPLSQVVSSGVHTLKVSKEGYLTREISINIEEGFRLTAWVFLAVDPYPQTKKLSEKEKFTLFDLSTENTNLSGDFSSWAQGIWHFQNTEKGVPQEFDLLIDENGKTYTLNKDYSKKKEINVGYLSKSPGKLSTEAKKEWDKLTN